MALGLPPPPEQPAVSTAVAQAVLSPPVPFAMTYAALLARHASPLPGTVCSVRGMQQLGGIADGRPLYRYLLGSCLAATLHALRSSAPGAPPQLMLPELLCKSEAAWVQAAHAGRRTHGRANRQPGAGGCQGSFQALQHAALAGALWAVSK